MAGIRQEINERIVALGLSRNRFADMVAEENDGIAASTVREFLAGRMDTATERAEAMIRLLEKLERESTHA